MDGKHGQGNKNYCEKFYTLDKVLLKVDLQSIRMNNIKKVCEHHNSNQVWKSPFYDYFGSVNVLDFSGLG